MKNYNKFYDEPQGLVEEETVIEEIPAPEPAQEFGIVNAREVYIRQGPGKDYDHVGTVKKGDELIVLTREGDFLKVETQEGLVAYIMEAFVDIVE